MDAGATALVSALDSIQPAEREARPSTSFRRPQIKQLLVLLAAMLSSFACATLGAQGLLPTLEPTRVIVRSPLEEPPNTLVPEPTAEPTLVRRAEPTDTPQPTATSTVVIEPTATPTRISEVLPVEEPPAPPAAQPTTVPGGTNPALPANTGVRWAGCASDGECLWYNFYWAPTREIVLQPGEGQNKVWHEYGHAHQHWSINRGEPLPPSDYDLESWYKTAEGISYVDAVSGLAWPWTHSAQSGLEDFAWTFSYWYNDPGYLLSVSPARYDWAAANLP
jgi:hypothetical protein